jgi:terminase large subunit-like protein
VESWRVAAAALEALTLEGRALELYRHHTGRVNPPAKPFREAYFCCGRRGGKSLISAFELTYEAAFRKHPELVRGERAVAMCLACDKDQAAVVLGYVKAFFREIPMLARLVAAERTDSIVLTTGVEIAVHTSSFRSVRGYTLLCVIADELAFWPNESSTDPAEEILAAAPRPVDHQRVAARRLLPARAARPALHRLSELLRQRRSRSALLDRNDARHELLVPRGDGPARAREG